MVVFLFCLRNFRAVHISGERYLSRHLPALRRRCPYTQLRPRLDDVYGLFNRHRFPRSMTYFNYRAIVVVVMLGITYIIAVSRHQRSQEVLQNVRHKHVSTVLLLTFLVYSSSSSLVFQMFDCEHLEDKN